MIKDKLVDYICSNFYAKGVLGSKIPVSNDGQGDFTDAIYPKIQYTVVHEGEIKYMTELYSKELCPQVKQYYLLDEDGSKNFVEVLSKERIYYWDAYTIKKYFSCSDILRLMQYLVERPQFRCNPDELKSVY